jgi:hypothetical protein
MKIKVNKLWVIPTKLSNPENLKCYTLYLWYFPCLGICHGNGKFYGIKFPNIRAFSVLEPFQFHSGAFCSAS